MLWVRPPLASSIPFSRGTVRELTAAVAQEGRRADGRRGPPPPAVADLRRLLVPRVDRWSSPQEDLCCGHAAPRRATPPFPPSAALRPTHALAPARGPSHSPLAPASNGVDCSGKHQGQLAGSALQENFRRPAGAAGAPPAEAAPSVSAVSQPLPLRVPCRPRPRSSVWSMDGTTSSTSTSISKLVAWLGYYSPPTRGTSS